MCGIAGIYRYGEEPIKEETIALLLAGNEHRGMDAAGLAFMQSDGSIQVSKLDVPAWKFTTTEQYEKFINDNLKDDTIAVIIHARGASQGSPRINNNNHPMYADKTAIIHNGHIRNDDEIFNKLKLDRKADTDSDVIRAIFDTYGFTEEALKMLNKLEGAAAGAAISPEYPKKLILFKSGSPMAIASTKNFLFFSSEKKTIYQAVRPAFKRFKIWFQRVQDDLAFTTIPEHTIWMIGPEGLEEHGEFKTCRTAYTEPQRRVYEDYSKRQEKWNEEVEKAKRSKGNGEPKIVTVMKTKVTTKNLFNCSNPRCDKQWLVPIGRDPKDFVCNKDKGGCGSTLNKNVIKQITEVVN